MANKKSRKQRKARQRARAEAEPNPPAASGQDAPEPGMARGYARARQRDEEARAALKPLEEGERPGAVTVAAILALVLGLANLIAYFAGLEVQGDRPQLTGVVLYSGLMLVAAWGCWRARYWAVLGMEALLGLAIIIFSILVIRAENVLSVVIALAVIGGAGWLFWKLVKAMARIQMPERPGAERP